MKIKIKSGSVEANAELLDNDIGKKIYENLPIEGSALTWGEEIYFEMPLYMDKEQGDVQVVDVGDLAYWSAGSGFCIFYGKTPMSDDDRPVAASKVKVFGKVTGDAKVFKDVNEGDNIVIEKWTK